MKKAARTLTLFVLCFAPAAAIFALTLEWARPAAPPFFLREPSPGPAADSSPPIPFASSPNEPPRPLPDWTNAIDGHPSVIVIDREGASQTLYSNGENDRDKTPLIDFLRRYVVTEAQTSFASFDDRLTRSAWVTLGLALVTLSGGFGLFLFQRRMQERKL